MKLSKLAPAGSPEAANCAWWIVCSLALQVPAACLLLLAVETLNLASSD